MLRTFIRDLIGYFPSMALPALTGFISIPILTRIFPPSEFALWALADGLSEFLLLMGILGIGAAVIRFLPAYDEKSQTSRFLASLTVTAGIVSLVLVLASLILVLLLRGVIADKLLTLLVISILIFALQSLFRAHMPVLRAQHRSGLYTIFELTERYGSLGFGLILVIAFGLGVEGLLWGALIASALVLPTLLYVTTRNIGFNLSDYRLADSLLLWRYAWPLALGGIAMWGLRISDRYILSLYRSVDEVGQYAVAYNISSKSIDMLVLLILFGAGPLVMNTWERHGEAAAKRSLAMISQVFIVTCLPAAVGLSLFASQFVAILTDPAYHKGYRIVGLIAFSSLVWGLSQLAGMGILIEKKTKRIAANQLIAAGVNIGLNILLIPLFGFMAAALTTLLGYIVLLALQVHTARPYLRWSFPFRTLRNSAISAALMAIVVVGVERLSRSEPLMNPLMLIVGVILGIVSYSAMLLVLERAEVARVWRTLKAGELV